MPSVTTPWTVRTLAGPSPATVGVRNLATRTTDARDAWGRPGKEQPLLLSASVEFASGFERAGKTDSLGGDTVHYGTLSKAILASTGNKNKSGGGLATVVGDAWTALTGRNVGSDGEKGAGMLGDEVRFLSVTARLPKASLLGSGVSWTVSECFGAGVYATSLSVHELRVPTLVGMNDNERLAKQFVIATVTVEGVEPIALQDSYTELERVVVKVCYAIPRACKLTYGRRWRIPPSRPSRRWPDILVIRPCRSGKSDARRFTSSWRSQQLLPLQIHRSWRYASAEVYPQQRSRFPYLQACLLPVEL